MWLKADLLKKQKISFDLPSKSNFKRNVRQIGKTDSNKICGLTAWTHLIEKTLSIKSINYDTSL